MKSGYNNNFHRLLWLLLLTTLWNECTDWSDEKCTGHPNWSTYHKHFTRCTIFLAWITGMKIVAMCVWRDSRVLSHVLHMSLSNVYCPVTCPHVTSGLSTCEVWPVYVWPMCMCTCMSPDRHPSTCDLLCVMLCHLQVLPMDTVFSSGCGSLLHLACALGHSDTIQSLLKRSQPNIKIWSNKDDEGQDMHCVS